jgi:ribose transport system substrate-binding protein
MQPIEVNAAGPVDVSKSRGKKFALIQFAREGNPVEIAHGITVTEAFSHVDAEVLIFDGKGRADILLQAFESAIAQGVSGIIADGFDMDVVRGGLAMAVIAGIPVVDVGASVVGGDLAPGVSSYVAVDAFNVGKLQGYYALAQTNCDLHTAVMPVTGASITVNMAAGTQEAINELCPHDCSVVPVQVDPATFLTELSSQVRTTLQRDRELNYWITSADFFTPFILQGMREAEKVLPVVGGAQGDGLADAMAGRNGLVATTVWPPAEIKGYMYADAMMRAVAGKPVNYTTPVRLVDASVWGDSAEISAQFPNIAEWKNSFLSAWGL